MDKNNEFIFSLSGHRASSCYIVFSHPSNSMDQIFTMPLSNQHSFRPTFRLGKTGTGPIPCSGNIQFKTFCDYPILTFYALRELCIFSRYMLSYFIFCSCSAAHPNIIGTPEGRANAACCCCQ